MSNPRIEIRIPLNHSKIGSRDLVNLLKSFEKIPMLCDLTIGCTVEID